MTCNTPRWAFILCLGTITIAYLTLPASAQKNEAARRQYEQGLEHQKAGDLEQAETAFRRAIQLDAAQAAYHQSLGVALTRQGRLKEAETPLRAALRLEPQNWQHYAVLAAVLEQQGQIREAEELQKKADELKRAGASTPTIGDTPPTFSNPPPGGSATTVQVRANQAWTPTGIVLQKDLKITLDSSGAVDAGADAYSRAVPPEGRAERMNRFPNPLLPGLALIGRIGNGEVFAVGANMKFIATTARLGIGELQLGINDDTPQDNTGFWTVRISTREPNANLAVVTTGKRITVEAATITAAESRAGNYFLLTVRYRLSQVPAEGVIVRGNTELKGPMKANSTLAGRTVRPADLDLKAQAGGEIDLPGDYEWAYTIKADGYETVTGQVRFKVDPAK